ncbi:hypothetical protein JCM39068_21730 [Desulfocastanea catecholica]
MSKKISSGGEVIYADGHGIIGHRLIRPDETVSDDQRIGIVIFSCSYTLERCLEKKIAGIDHKQRLPYFRPQFF